MFTLRERQKRNARIVSIIFGIFILVLYYKWPESIARIGNGEGEKFLKYFPYVGYGFVALGLVLLVPLVIKRLRIMFLLAQRKYVYASYTSIDEHVHCHTSVDDDGRNSETYTYDYTVHFTYTDENGVRYSYIRDYFSNKYIPFHEGDLARVYFDPSDPEVYYVSEHDIRHLPGYDASKYKKSLYADTLVFVSFAIIAGALCYKFIGPGRGEDYTETLIPFIALTCFPALISLYGLTSIIRKCIYNFRIR